MNAFKAKGIGCGIHYPVTMNAQPAFAVYGYKPGQFPVSEERAARIISLPFFPEMSVEQMQTALSTFLQVAKP